MTRTASSGMAMTMRPGIVNPYVLRSAQATKCIETKSPQCHSAFDYTCIHYQVLYICTCWRLPLPKGTLSTASMVIIAVPAGRKRGWYWWCQDVSSGSGTIEAHSDVTVDACEVNMGASSWTKFLLFLSLKGPVEVLYKNTGRGIGVTILLSYQWLMKTICCTCLDQGGVQFISSS